MNEDPKKRGLTVISPKRHFQNSHQMSEVQKIDQQIDQKKVQKKTCVKCGDEFYTLHSNYRLCEVCYFEASEQEFSPKVLEERRKLMKDKIRNRMRRFRKLRQHKKNAGIRGASDIVDLSHSRLNDQIRTLCEQVRFSSNLTVGTCYRCQSPFILSAQLWNRDVPVLCGNCKAFEKAQLTAPI